MTVAVAGAWSLRSPGRAGSGRGRAGEAVVEVSWNSGLSWLPLPAALTLDLVFNTRTLAHGASLFASLASPLLLGQTSPVDKH